MSSRVAAVCWAVVLVVAVVVAVAVTPWALVVVPFALVLAVAAWNGVGALRVLDLLGDSSDDPGRGPAGLNP